MFEIHVTKEVGSKSKSFTTLSFDSQERAIQKYKDLANAEKEELDRPEYRFVGARTELFLFKTAQLFDDSDCLLNTVIKRPLNTPCASAIDVINECGVE
jgi:hypothetical protein